MESNHKIDYKLIVKSNTRQVQGIIFQKGQYQFKGSEIDRNLSFSKINAFFEEQKQASLNSNTGATKQEALESALNTAMGLFTPESHGPDPLEDEFRRRMQKKEKRGFRL